MKITVDVLMIQTHDMVELLKRGNPRVYQSDTTFGTSKEGYKLHVLTLWATAYGEVLVPLGGAESAPIPSNA